MSRPARQQWWMDQARVTATAATCSRLHVGAILVRDGVQIGQGYNGAPRGEEHCLHPPGNTHPCEASVHAEENALVNAAVDGHATRGALMVITHAPCYRCAGVIINARLAGVLYGEVYRSASGLNRLRNAGVAVVRLDAPLP